MLREILTLIAAFLAPRMVKNLKHLPVQCVLHGAEGMVLGSCVPGAAAAQAGLSRGGC